MTLKPEYRFDKTKYADILAREGESAAITALHHDMRELEHECFESPAGWQPELFEELKKYRDFSLKPWDVRYDQAKSV